VYEPPGGDRIPSRRRKMTNRKIGFTPNPVQTETREKKFGNLTVLYMKQRKSSGVFMYNCECRRENQSSATGFDSDRPELSWEEIEEIPRFRELVASYLPG
jgi:hypothetical protein